MMEMIVVITLLTSLLTWLIYHLLPGWLSPLSPEATGAKIKFWNRGHLDATDGSSVGWQQRLSGAATVWLMRSGRIEPDSRKRFWLISSLTSLAAGLAAVLYGRPVGIGCLITLLSGFLFSRVAALQVMRLEKAFERDLFKIYRFIDLQLSAGVRLTDTLCGLAEAAPGSPIRMFLQRFSAVYQLTYDLDQAAEELRRLFPGADMNLLKAHLEQTLQTGRTGRSLLRMENLLFARYFSCLQTESAALRRSLLWLALIGLLPTLAALLAPLLMSAAQALSILFSL